MLFFVVQKKYLCGFVSWQYYGKDLLTCSSGGLQLDEGYFFPILVWIFKNRTLKLEGLIAMPALLDPTKVRAEPVSQPLSVGAVSVPALPPYSLLLATDNYLLLIL